jgi:predicted MFS family arabinose efflux permease
MILLAAFIVSLAVAWALGASLGRLADVRFRGEWLVFAALIVQIALFTPLADPLPARVIPPLHIVSYLALLAFLACNLRRPGIWLIAVGACSNALVIIINGGVMPVSLAAWKASGHAANLIERSGRYHNNGLDNAHTHLSLLGDIFPLPPGIPFASAISIGDVLIVLGMTAFVYRSCVSAPARPHARVFAPLQVAAYRQVLAGRLCSSLGDWIAMTAVVTWVYDRQHSTAAVSIFMVARILAATIGGTASAPLLDRLQGFRALTSVETSRGLISVGILIAAVSGQVAAVIVLVCASSFLGAATNPSARSLIPEVLPPDQLHAGNSLHGVARNLTMVVGTAAAAFSVSQFGVATALLIDIISFAAAAILYYRFRNLARPAAPPKTGRHSRRTLLRWLATNPVGFGLTASFAVVTAGIGMFNSSLPAFLTHRLGDTNAYGYGLATIGAGLMVGEFLTAFLRRQTVARRSIPIAFTASAAILFGFATSGATTTAYLLLFLLGASDGITEVVYDTLMQLSAPPRIRAGVFALAAAIKNTGMVIGFSAAALAAATMSPQTAMIIAAGTVLLGAPFALPILTRSGSPQPDHLASQDSQPSAPDTAARTVAVTVRTLTTPSGGGAGLMTRSDTDVR